MSKKVTVVFVKQTLVRADPGLLNRYDNFKTDQAWGQSWWKSHKQETPTLLTDADKSTDKKRKEKHFFGGLTTI